MRRILIASIAVIVVLVATAFAQESDGNGKPEPPKAPWSERMEALHNEVIAMKKLLVQQHEGNASLTERRITQELNQATNERICAENAATWAYRILTIVGTLSVLLLAVFVWRTLAWRQEAHEEILQVREYARESQKTLSDLEEQRQRFRQNVETAENRLSEIARKEAAKLVEEAERERHLTDLLMQAMRQQATGDYKGHLHTLTSYLKLDPPNKYIALRDKGTTHLVLKQYDEAIASFREAFKDLDETAPPTSQEPVIKELRKMYIASFSSSLAQALSAKAGRDGIECQHKLKDEVLNLLREAAMFDSKYLALALVDDFFKPYHGELKRMAEELGIAPARVQIRTKKDADNRCGQESIC